MMDLRLNMDEYLPLREVVFKTLRNAIVHGEFEPGERLMEVTLAKRLGVSRTPVRADWQDLEKVSPLSIEKYKNNLQVLNAQVASAISNPNTCLLYTSRCV